MLGNFTAHEGTHETADEKTSAPEMSANSRINVIHQLEKLSNAKPFSLEAYINKRMDLMKGNDPSLANDEGDLLWKLMKLRRRVSSLL